MCVFDEKCEPGIEALAAYHAKVDEDRQIDLGAVHNWASHAADSFGAMAVDYEPPKKHDPRVTGRLNYADNRAII